MARFHRPNTQKNVDSVTAFLNGRPNVNFCDECVREALHLTRSNLTEKDLYTNAVNAGLIRTPDKCSSCGKQRMTTRTT
jgi:hypothetical protein